MKQTFALEGMTCENCKAIVAKAIMKVDGVSSVDVDLNNKEVNIVMDHHIETKTFQLSLPEKYTIADKRNNKTSSDQTTGKSKLIQLKPLFFILFYITAGSILLHIQEWNIKEMMTDFMGLFFIVFSFFKMLDLAGFAVSFSMYDPLANRLPAYAKVYPFIETILGLMLLMRFQINLAFLATIMILGLTTYGVAKTCYQNEKLSVRV